MERIISLALALLFPISSAVALTQASIPPKFPTVWAGTAGAAYVTTPPTTSQIGIVNCAASLPDGFPPLTFVPASAGGCPPFGKDMNGILRQLSQWNQWQGAGGPVFYDSSFASSIGGYPSGAILMSTVTPGTMWMSTADSNTADPDGATPTGWVQAPGQVPIGTPTASLTTSIPTGYVSANGLTIGDASSNATNRANADTKFLFAKVWENCGNSLCAIFTSGGIASTRGASAFADFAAHKAITLWNMNGSALMGADSQSGSTSVFLVGVPAVVGLRTTPGAILGENLHALSSAENGTHTHANALSDPGHAHTYSNAPVNINNNNGGGGGAFGAIVANVTASTSTVATGVVITNAASGSGTAHNTVARSTIVYWNLKL